MSNDYIATVQTPKGELQFDYESMAKRPKKFVNINVGNTTIAPLEENDTFAFASNDNIILTTDVDKKTIGIDINNAPLACTIRDMLEPTLINDDTKKVYGMTNSADVNDIFTFFRDTITRHVLEVRVMTNGGMPIEGAVISGLEKDIVTDEKGRALYRVIAGATKVTLTVTVPEKYQDVVRTKTVDHLPTDAFHQFCEIRMDRSNSIVISKSTTLTFSPDVAELSISCAGGGGGGGGGAESNYHNEEEHTWSYSGGGGGGGGGGGYVANETVKLEEKENVVHVVVGAGGSGGVSVFYNYHTDKKIHYSGPALSGKDGGESYVILNDASDIKYAVAAGGKGGTGGYATTRDANGGIGGIGGEGNGAGGTGSVYGIKEDDDGDYHYVYNRPADGKNATETLGDTDIKVGGGGAGGSGNDAYTANGGLPYGGSLVKVYYDDDEDEYYVESKSATGYAGGGSGGVGGMNHRNGAAGHSGVVAITWKFRDEITEEKPEEETPTE